MDDLFSLKGRNAVIVGGAGGIGRGLAKAFLEYGARVAIADVNAEAMEQVVAEIEKATGQKVGTYPVNTDQESRVQDLVAKHERYGDTFTWDFIGHLQSRKTKQVLPLVRLIHGVDSMSVVQEVQRLSANTTRVLLEVNIGEEETKSGVAPDRVDAFLEEAATYDRVEFVGLMCMPPLGVSAPSSAPYFARTRELAARLSTAWRGRYTFAGLSMGTSADYDVAVSEGATIVRVGSVLF